MKGIGIPSIPDLPRTRMPQGSSLGDHDRRYRTTEVGKDRVLVKTVISCSRTYRCSSKERYESLILASGNTVPHSAVAWVPKLDCLGWVVVYAVPISTPLLVLATVSISVYYGHNEINSYLDSLFLIACYLMSLSRASQFVAFTSIGYVTSLALILAVVSKL